jgi:hypothetical protein
MGLHMILICSKVIFLHFSWHWATWSSLLHTSRDVPDIRRRPISGWILAIRWLFGIWLKHLVFFSRISYWSGSEACVSCPRRQFQRQQELHWLPFPEGITFRLAVLAYMYQYHCQNGLAPSLYTHPTSESCPAQLNELYLADNLRTKHSLSVS